MNMVFDPPELPPVVPVVLPPPVVPVVLPPPVVPVVLPLSETPLVPAVLLAPVAPEPPPVAVPLLVEVAFVLEDPAVAVDDVPPPPTPADPLCPDQAGCSSMQAGASRRTAAERAIRTALPRKTMAVGRLSLGVIIA